MSNARSFAVGGAPGCAMQQRLQWDVVGGEVFKRQIDSIALCILGDIAQNVGQLERNSCLFRQLFRARICITEDPYTDQPHNRCH